MCGHFGRFSGDRWDAAGLGVPNGLVVLTWYICRALTMCWALGSVHFVHDLNESHIKGYLETEDKLTKRCQIKKCSDVMWCKGMLGSCEGPPAWVLGHGCALWAISMVSRPHPQSAHSSVPRTWRAMLRLRVCLLSSDLMRFSVRKYECPRRPSWFFVLFVWKLV